MLSQEMGGSQVEDSLNLELQQYKKKNQQLRRKLREKDSKIHQLFNYIDNASKQLVSPEISRIQQSVPPPKIHHSEPRRKEKQNKQYQLPDNNIFNQNRSMIEKHPTQRQNLQLPALERSRNIFQEEEGNPQRKKVIKVAVDRLKPLNTDEIRKRFLLRFQPETHE